jgi:hypothetical protein
MARAGKHLAMRGSVTVVTAVTAVTVVTAVTAVTADSPPMEPFAIHKDNESL